MASVVDSQGNINGSVLQLELQEALQSDVRYKQIDNMKKRAVKVATDYDEFKAMVSCAHLKKLTSKEVESLSTAKKGWKKTHVKDTSANLQVLSKELLNEAASVDIQPLKTGNKSKGPKLPKTCMELDRDLRRIKTIEEKQRLLNSMGSKKTCSMLAQGGDTDILEQVLIILVANVPKHTETTEEQSNELLIEKETLVEWLRLLSESSQFNMMIQLASNDLLADVQRKLIFAENLIDSSLLETYSKKRS